METENSNQPDPDEPLGLTARQRERSNASEKILGLLGDGTAADLLLGSDIPPMPSTLHNVHNQQRMIT